MENIRLRVPLEQVKVNQPFGVNFLDFYQQWGMKGHNGVDFSCKDNTPVYASHDGIVYYCGTDSTGGIEVDIWNKENLYKTIYYHLKSYVVKQGDIVKAGDLIAYSDNTGKYTTGAHLHYGLKRTSETGATINYGNGYNGAIDPSPYFVSAYNGFKIGSKDYDKSRCYQRYYREAKRNLANEMKVALYIARRLGRLPNNEEINAAIWGGWDIESIMNPSMYAIYSQLKKSEYLEGKRVNTTGI